MKIEVRVTRCEIMQTLNIASLLARVCLRETMAHCLQTTNTQSGNSPLTSHAALPYSTHSSSALSCMMRDTRPFIKSEHSNLGTPQTSPDFLCTIKLYSPYVSLLTVCSAQFLVCIRSCSRHYLTFYEGRPSFETDSNQGSWSVSPRFMLARLH